MWRLESNTIAIYLNIGYLNIFIILEISYSWNNKYWIGLTNMKSKIHVNLSDNK
jgi:hypothetical protein